MMESLPTLTYHHTAMAVETEVSDLDSEQDEYLSAEEPELESSIDISSVRDNPYWSGARRR